MATTFSFEEAQTPETFSFEDVTEKPAAIPKIDLSQIRGPESANQPSMFSSGLGNLVAPSENPDYRMTKFAAEHPKEFLKEATIDTPMAMAGIVGKPLAAAAHDIGTTISGHPEFGGNLYEMFNSNGSLPEHEAPLPYQKIQSEIAQSHPIAATASKVATGAIESAPLLIAGALPSAVQKLIALGFSADMIRKAPQLARDLGTELGKPPEQRDMDKLTSLASEAIQTGVFAPLAAAHGAGKLATEIATPKTAAARALAEQLSKGDFNPETETPTPQRRLGIQLPGTTAGDVLATPERQDLANRAIAEQTGQKLFTPGEVPAIEQLANERKLFPQANEATIQVERPGGGPAQGGKISFAAPAEARGVPSARQSALIDYVKSNTSLPQPPDLIRQVSDVVTSKDRLELENLTKQIEKNGPGVGTKSQASDVLRLLRQRLDEIKTGKINNENEAIRKIISKPAEKVAAKVTEKPPLPTVKVSPAGQKLITERTSNAERIRSNQGQPVEAGKGPEGGEANRGGQIQQPTPNTPTGGVHKEGNAAAAEIAKEIGYRFNPERQFAGIKSEGLTPEERAKLEAVMPHQWEFTNPNTGITFYMPEGSSRESVIARMKQIEAQSPVNKLATTPEAEPTVESVTPLDPQTGQPLSATESLVNKLEAPSQSAPRGMGSALRAMIEREGNRHSEAAFVNLSILADVVEHGKAILKQGMDFGKWSVEMVKQLGENSLRYLKSAWDQINPDRKVSVKEAVDAWRSNGLEVNFDFDEKTGLPKPPEFVSNFAKNDIAPLLKRGVDAMRAAKDLIVNTFSPVSKGSTPDVDALFEAKGYKDELVFKAAAAMNSARKFMGGLPQSDQIAFADRVKRGIKQPTPELQQIADTLRQWDDRIYGEVAKYKPDLPYLENHLRVLWKVIPGSPEARGTSAEGIMSKRPWQGTKGFLKKHVLEDMSEGIKAGGVPVTYNPVELSMLGIQDAMKFVAANRAWEALKKTGGVELVEKGEAPPPGYTRISDSIAKVYFKVPAGFVQKGEYWVEPNTARLVNNYLSRDYIRENALGRGLLDLKNATTAIELGLSPFHAVFESNEVVGSSIGLGLAKMFSGKPIEGVKDIATSIASPKTTAKIGGAAIRYAANPDQFKAEFPDAYKWFTGKYPQAGELIKDLWSGGGKLEMHEDYRIRAGEKFQEALKNNNYISALVKSVPALNRQLMKPLFETYIPRLKIGMFLREYAFELERRQNDLASGKITRGELARKTWSFVDDRFGELNWDNLFWDRTFKTSMQLLFRSVTWKLGNLRGFGKAANDTLRELGVDWWKEGRAPRLTLPMGWLVGMSVVTGLQAAVISKVTTGKYPWELAKDTGELARNLTFPRIDANDQSQRVSVPTYWRDAVHLSHSVPDYVRSSMTGEIGRVADVWQNRDFYGVQVFNPDDPALKKGTDILEHMIPLPFGAQSYIGAQRTGETGARSAAGFLGFTKAPYYMSYTPAEQLASELTRARTPQGSRTREEYDRAIKERKALAAIRRGETTIPGAVADGLIDRSRMKIAKEKIKDTPLQYGVLHLSASDAVKVYLAASPQERTDIENIVKRHIENSKVLTKEQKLQLKKTMRDAQ